MSNRRLPILVGKWERWVDGVESVLDERVWHRSRVTVRRGDVNSRQGGNLRRRDGISSPIPVWRSQILGRSQPAILILVSLGNVKSMPL